MPQNTPGATRASRYGTTANYFAQAQRSQNTSVYNVLMSAGHPEAANIVKEL